MELSETPMLYLFNIFREYDGKDNCAQVLEEEISKLFGTKSLNDEHDCNVVSMNSLNIHSTNDDCSSHDENISALFGMYLQILCTPQKSTCL